jgi:hypothetical protein
VTALPNNQTLPLSSTKRNKKNNEKRISSKSKRIQKLPTARKR